MPWSPPPVPSASPSATPRPRWAGGACAAAPPGASCCTRPRTLRPAAAWCSWTAWTARSWSSSSRTTPRTGPTSGRTIPQVKAHDGATTRLSQVQSSGMGVPEANAALLESWELQLGEDDKRPRTVQLYLEEVHRFTAWLVEHDRPVDTPGDLAAV